MIRSHGENTFGHTKLFLFTWEMHFWADYKKMHSPGQALLVLVVDSSSSM